MWRYLLPPSCPRLAIITPDLVSENKNDFPCKFTFYNLVELYCASKNKFREILTESGSFSFPYSNSEIGYKANILF